LRIQARILRARLEPALPRFKHTVYDFIFLDLDLLVNKPIMMVASSLLPVTEFRMRGEPPSSLILGFYQEYLLGKNM
jgi:hypothetical protein